MNYREKIIDEYEGKVIWFCETSGTNGQRINFDPYCISFCHEHEIVRPSELVISDIRSFSIDKYYESVYTILKKMQDENFPCRECSHCKKGEFFLQPINGLVTISTSVYCNSSCIYCMGHFGMRGEGYDPLPLIKPFVENKLFGKKVLFDWGGGEPTKNNFYEDTVKYLLEQDFRQRFNTNAIEFSQSIYNALDRDKGIARISVDSGSRDGYLYMKGTDNYENVWENITRYCSISDNVFVKYNICNYNSDKEEIDAFLFNCRQSEVRHIIISAEATAYQPTKNAGPFYYREKELIAAKYMESRAVEMGLNVIISEYPYETRAEYLGRKLMLPGKYFDNIDREIISNNIYVKTFANIDLFLQQIKSIDREVLIFGAGTIGKKAGEILSFAGIDFNFMDNREELDNTWIDGHLCNDAKTIIKVKPQAQIVLAGEQWKAMLKQINDAKYNVNNFLYWMPKQHYDNYMK